MTEYSHESYENNVFADLVGALLDVGGRKRVAYFCNGNENKWVAFDYVSTGRLVKNQFSVSKSVYSAEVPEMMTVETGSAETLHQLANTHASEILQQQNKYDSESSPYSSDPVAETRDVKFFDTLEKRFSDEFTAFLNETNSSSTNTLIECRHCEGTGSVSRTCWDCDQGVRNVHMGMIADKNDLIIDTPEDEHDIVFEVLDCPKCRGTKSFEKTCFPCNGTGEVSRFLQLSFVSENGVETISTNLAELLNTQDAVLVFRRNSREETANLNVYLDFSNLRKRLNDSLVGEGKKMLFYQGRHFTTVDSFLSNIHFSTLRVAVNSEGEYALRSWVRSGVGNYMDPVETPTSIEEAYSELVGANGISGLWNHAQEEYSSQFRYVGEPEEWNSDTRRQYLESLSFTVNEDTLVVSGMMVSAVEQFPNMQVLHDIARLVESKNLGVELSYGFIATEQYGPQVLLCTRSGIAFYQIGLDYSWNTALSSALFHVRSMLEKIPSSEKVEEYVLLKREERESGE